MIPPEERESREPGGPAEFVGAGSFRIDRSRAVRKLQRFQSLGDLNPILLWVRCANACRASEIRIRQLGLWSEVRFDGEPFGSIGLHDALGALFAKEDETSPAARFLALGLIQALNWLPRRVIIRSGPGRERTRLTVTPTRMPVRASAGVPEVLQAVEPAEAGDETDTSIQVEWSPLDSARSQAMRLSPEDCYRRCVMSRASIAMEEDLVVDPAEDPPGVVRFEDDGTRGVMARGMSGDAELFHYGVHVCPVTVQVYLPGPFWVNDDQVSLNASMSGAVRNARYRKILSVIRIQAERYSSGI